MDNTNKSFSLLLVIILAASSLIFVESAFAQPIPKPSVPKFTANFVNASYSVTTTNPYTGANETQQILNNSIEVKINNQPFDYSNNQIYYNIRVKPHFQGNWTEVYPIQNRTSSYNADGTFSYAQYINADSSRRSNSSFTSISFPVVATEYYGESGYDIQRYYSGDRGQEGEYFEFLHGIPDDAQIDFQVEALLGQNSTYWYVMHPFFPQYGGFNEPAIAYETANDWSNTQTITIGEVSAPPAPSPTVPEFHPLTILLLFSIAVAFVSLLVYHKKHNQVS